MANIPQDFRTSNVSGIGIFIGVVLLVGGFILLRQFVGDGMSPTVNMPARTTVEAPAVPGALPNSTSSTTPATNPANTPATSPLTTPNNAAGSAPGTVPGTGPASTPVTPSQ